jgi:hypothetical protein
VRVVQTGKLAFAGYNGPGTFPYMVPLEEYVEFDEADGQFLAQKFLAKHGSQSEAFHGCTEMFALAAARQDRTTINGCREALRYMRRNGWQQ